VLSVINGYSGISSRVVSGLKELDRYPYSGHSRLMAKIRDNGKMWIRCDATKMERRYRLEAMGYDFDTVVKKGFRDIQNSGQPYIIARQTTGTGHGTQCFSLLVCQGIGYFRD
jgi:hypothetical protein